VADAIRNAKRGFDSAARVGGEEFAVLAPDCDEHGAYMLAERIRAAVQEALSERDDEPPLTISFGISTFPLHGQSAEGLLMTADQALYAAKRLGRNRSVISSAEVPGILARAPRRQDESQVELGNLLELAEAMDVLDSGTISHCHRVGRFAELIARELGLAPDSVERVRIAGILHDLGRVGMPDELLAKAGPLDEGDWAWVRSHPEIGARMVETTEHADIRSWILSHHERPDGRGYPAGRPAAEVPLEARILGVADAYEAMTSERPYRAAMPASDAADELRRGAGTQFDELVVEALLRAV
jgi:putative nucleotidyltransferase with HDIG domain